MLKKAPGHGVSANAKQVRALPGVVRPPGRLLLRAWARFPKATGYLSQAIERWGARLALEPLERVLSNGLKLKCNLRDHVQRQIYFRGVYEPVEAYVFECLLRPGMVVVDAGANVGQYALLAARVVGPTGEVHAFEPVPKTLAELEENVVSNGYRSTVRTNQLALWDRPGRVELRLPSDMVGNAGSFTAGEVTSAAARVNSEAVRLDDYLKNKCVRRLDFLKMDVEGAELRALMGARVMLDTWRPNMLLEINRESSGRLGYQPEQIWKILKPYGYRIWLLGEYADECRSLSSLRGLDRANVLLHTGPLPEAVTRGWGLKAVLRRYARSGTERRLLNIG